MTSGSHPSLPLLATGPQIRSMISTSYHPTQPWTPTQLRTKSDMVLPGPQGSPESPLFLQSSSKGWGPQGGSPHCSLRPSLAGSRAEAHGRLSPDTSSSVDREHRKSPPAPENMGCRPLHWDASQNANTATLSPALTTAPRMGMGSHARHCHFQMRRQAESI